MRFRTCILALLALALMGPVSAQNPLGMLHELPMLKDYKAMRSSSSDPNWRDGNHDFRSIAPGETLVLAQLEGPGRITHIWFTIAHNERFYGKKLVLRMFWDGEENPSVESPMNDFFCQGHGLDLNVNSLPFRVTANGRARNCYFPMPFRKSARIEVTNEGNEPCRSFYYYIDWQKLESLPENTAYFHAKYRQEFPCKAGEDYLILYAEGEGHFVGCNLSVRSREPHWWGEGDDFFYIDGEEEPSLKGTGSEDYFCDAWGIRQQDGLFYGATIVEGYDTNDRATAYRFHITDLVPFKKSLKMTIEHKGAGPMPDGTFSGFRERFDDFSSVAYWYQVEPHVEFAKMPPVEERLYPSISIEIEGESLVSSAEGSEPKIQIQHLAGWSGGNHLFYLPEQADASLTVKFPIENAGKYDMRIYLTKSWDYGIYQILFNGKETGKPIDLYSPDIALTPAVKLGRHELSAGEHTIQFKCVGKNKSSKGYFFGLDLIELFPAN